MAEANARVFPTPSQFYRAQRPERFSDSVQVDKPSLNRSMLEYHLGTLTSRSQEIDFETFARGLAERRVAPNLIPHTGPTGGGDSKVDSETFPVSDALALSWFVGIGREASSERWGFAFSAKADWQPKLKSDIAKLAATQRGYKKAFFITNQFVKDRDRAKLEDQLSKTHKLDVRIFDLTWILDSVFEGRHETFAIDALRLPAELRPEIVKGPRDVEREQRLAELEARIEEANSSGRLDIIVVQDALRSATTARGLERPRTEVDGRFLRAQRLAERLSDSSELLRVKYNWAWTTFFWFEDYDQFVKLADEVLELALESENAHELELPTILFGLLRTATSQGYLDRDKINFTSYGQRLLKTLDHVAGIAHRQSNALHARTLTLQTRLLLQPNRATALLKELRKVIERAQRMIGYPFEQTAELITALEPFLGPLEAYAKLFDRVVEITSKRTGDVSAAKMLLKRGAQQLERGADVEAIRSLGQALGRLYKNESRDDVIRALYLAGVAYDRLDLPWAARGSLIIAAGLAVEELHKFNRITREQAACYDRLRWLELRLGRLPQALEWHTTFALTSSALGDRQENDFDRFDAVAGIQMLKADLTALRQLETLPDILDSLGLYTARSALLFALGQPSELPADLFDGEDRLVGEVVFMQQWRDQPAAGELRDLSLGTVSPIVLESNVLGCHVELTCENRSPAIDVAESVLGGLESLLSTGLDTRMVAREPLLKINVSITEFAEAPFSFRLEYVLGRLQLHVACREFSPHTLVYEDQANIKKRLVELLIQTFAHIVALPDEKMVIRKLFRDENALERAVDFTNTFVSLGNVLGYRPKLSLDEWVTPEAKRYPLIREEVWDAAARSARLSTERFKPAENASRQDGRASIRDFKAPSRHSQLRTVSLIREKLWNEAGWSGIGYVSSLSDAVPPAMALLFRNSGKAIEIFEGLREDLGDEDAGELLRVSIVRSISTRYPTHYRVILGTDPEAMKGKMKPLTDRVVMISRTHTMTPDAPGNLERFLASYEKWKAYYLAPGTVSPVHGPMMGEPKLLKRRIYTRAAWEIGRHDTDNTAIHEDDDIPIPRDKSDAPVKELLTWLKRKKPKR